VKVRWSDAAANTVIVPVGAAPDALLFGDALLLGEPLPVAAVPPEGDPAEQAASVRPTVTTRARVAERSSGFTCSS
jgi:hypothetical protein